MKFFNFLSFFKNTNLNEILSIKIKNFLIFLTRVHDDVLSVFETIIVKLTFNCIVILETFVLVSKFTLYIVTLMLNLFVMHLTKQLYHLDDYFIEDFWTTQGSLIEDINNYTVKDVYNFNILHDSGIVEKFTIRKGLESSSSNTPGTIKRIAENLLQLDEKYKKRCDALRSRILISNVYLCLVSYLNMILTEIAVRNNIEIPPFYIWMDSFFLKGSLRLMVGNLLQEVKEVISPTQSILKLRVIDALPLDLNVRVNFVQRDIYGDIINKDLDKKVNLNTIKNTLSTYLNGDPNLIISNIKFTNTPATTNNENQNSDYYYCVAECKKLFLEKEGRKWLPLSLMTVIFLGTVSIVIST